ARARFAPVIGRPASCSQNRLCRYSSSASVARSSDIEDSLPWAWHRLGRVRIDGSTRALVTGASRGIGRALAEALAGRGATVGLVARSADEVQALAAELPGDHVALPGDVSDRAGVERAVARFVEAAGGLDLAV